MHFYLVAQHQGEVTSPALKGFRRLPEKAAAAIVEFLTGPLADNPCRLSKPLHE
jgi:mRNA interferase RelE/StbE